MAWAQPVAAACDPRDLADAVVVSLETTSVCEPVCEDKYRCYGAAILGGALTVVANREGQERVDLFCNAVQGQASEVIGQVQEVLKYQFVQEQLGKVSGYLSDYASDAQQVTAIVKCACATEWLNIKNQNSFGACANSMLQGVGCGSIDFKTGVIESCTPGGKIIQDFFNATWGGLKSIGCDSNLTSWLFDCGVGGTAGPRFTQCYAGYQSDMNGKCRVCGEVANGITLPNGRCGCAAAFVPVYVYRSNTRAGLHQRSGQSHALPALPARPAARCGPRCLRARAPAPAARAQAGRTSPPGRAQRDPPRAATAGGAGQERLPARYPAGPGQPALRAGHGLSAAGAPARAFRSRAAWPGGWPWPTTDRPATGASDSGP